MRDVHGFGPNVRRKRGEHGFEVAFELVEFLRFEDRLAIDEETLSTVAGQLFASKTRLN